MDKISLLKPMNERQKDMQQSMAYNTVTLASGFAGTGKSLMALNFGLTMVSQGDIKKIVYTRPDVSTDFQRGRGSLPGDQREKSLPLLWPLLDNIGVFCKPGLANYLIEKEVVEYVFLEDIRGRSFNDCFIILDEAQNTTATQLITVLTRIGKNSKMTVIGDTTQVDVSPLRVKNGLTIACDKLNDCPNVGIVEFEKHHIVRNSIVREIINRFY
jgi:phosphate starvation-inducible PhoH-like protein